MRFKKKSIQNSEISTASMPDIVFLLLFFFMVSATIKTNEDQLKVNIPTAHAISQVKKKFLIKELHVGFPKDVKLGTAARISAEGQIIEIDQITQWVQQQKASLGELYKDQMIVLLRADEEVEMGLIGDIQTELRRSNARKVLYRTLEEI